MTMVRGLILFLAVYFLAGCSSSEHVAQAAYRLRIVSLENNLDNVPGYVFRSVRVVKRLPLKQKRLKLLVLNSLNSYFVYNGKEFGLEYELLRLYAEERGMTIELSMVSNMRQVYDSLYYGDYDMAAGTAIKCHAFDTLYPQTNALYETDIVIIQRKAMTTGVSRPLTTRLEDLPENSVGVVDNSPVYFCLKEMGEKSGLRSTQLKKVGMGNSREGLIEMVNDGLLSYAVVNRHEASILAAIYTDLDFSLVVSRKANVSVFVNPYSAGLQQDFNSWLRKHKRTTDYAWIIIKYDTLYHDIKEKYSHATPVVMAGVISQYDALIVKYSKELGWDWRLLAAQIFQESRFDPNKKSWMGAIGLMQVMPSVANKYGGVHSTKLVNPEINIQTGVKYLKWLHAYYARDRRMNSEERLKFILAAYNAGVGHVQDARLLAIKYGLNPNVWDNNVERMMLNKAKPFYYQDQVCKYGYCRGKEPVQYVKNILMYFQHYSNVVKH